VTGIDSPNALEASSDAWPARGTGVLPRCAQLSAPLLLGPAAKRRFRSWTKLSAALICVFGALSSRSAQAETLTLWHAYRAAEQEALTKVIADFEATYPGDKIRTLAVPYDAFASKLGSAIPRGNGPDVFIYAHERIGGWAEAQVIDSVDLSTLPLDANNFLKPTRDALVYQGKSYGVPLAFKSVALFYNRALVPTPPDTSDEMIALARRVSFRTQPASSDVGGVPRFEGAQAEEEKREGSEGGGERFGLAWPSDEFYFHAPWLFGFGGKLFDEQGVAHLDTPAMASSLLFVRGLLEQGLIPQEGNTALATRLFNEGRAAMVVNGPWFVGEISAEIDYGIAVLPVISSTHLPARPFLTVEALLFAHGSAHRAMAERFAAQLATDEGASTRAILGRQAVAFSPSYDLPELRADPVLSAFRAQLSFSEPMSNRPEMQGIWEPAKGALKSVLRGADVKLTLARAEARLKANNRPRPPRGEPMPFVLAVGLVLLMVVGFWTFKNRELSPWRGLKTRIWEGRGAYAYLAPAFLGLGLLVLMPFVVGFAMGFTHYDPGAGGEIWDKFSFVGFANFEDILFGESYGWSDPLSFGFTLVVTVMWTLANVVLHVGIGLSLALLLARPWLKLKGVYRALLIVPWAVPNYITALIWKGMFHHQYGAINGLLETLGLTPVAWFSKFSTAFAADVITNTWLGFPFMMVVALGALQSIPSDIYEAAAVDGATPGQRFLHLTLPLLRPAMLPAVILGMIWTFNMFNIIYLVSGGEPDGSTDILISEAYRWAFQRQNQYGYAAAYATLIFVILVIYTLTTRRIAGGEDD